MLRYIPDPEGGGSQFAERWLRSAGGAELNVTVALSRLGWGGRARWVSVVPEGILGDDFLSLLAKAYPDGRGEENLALVRREPGDVGIYHVWPDKHQLWYQRHRSIFGLMDPAWFEEAFWRRVLSEPSPAPGPQAPHVLHLTGITPQITPGAHRAWWRALKAARSLKEGGAGAGGAGPRVVVTLDLNHRPALGAWEDLWIMVEPHLGTLDLLVLSVDDLGRIGEVLGVPEATALKDLIVPKGSEGAKPLDVALQGALKAVQQRLGHRSAIAATCKVREPTKRAEELPEQLRWSMVCLKSGEVVSTLATGVRQRPREEIGGGDSWLSGVIDGLVGSPAAARAAPQWSAEMWLSALEQGDMLATLKQEVVGDFSNVERDQLDAALAAHKAECARR